jgi:membrane-associated phospholipid phosphatase
MESSDSISLFQNLLHQDYALMLKINRDWTISAFDTIALFIREPSFWIPLYVFLILFIILNFGRKGLYCILTLILLVSVSDAISSHLIKPLFYRPRPCNDEVMALQIRFLAKTCGLNGSFTSSHATNHFAIAMFIYQMLKKTSPFWAIGFFWAGVISYAQVYVGVHYPLDIIGGALLGNFLGFFFARIFNNQIGLGIQ